MTYLERTRAFFAPRAATWDERFPDDDAAFRAAIADVRIERGAVVVDLGCGTGRALSLLRDAAGPGGTVVGVDATPEMLLVAAERRGRDARGLVLADAMLLPFGEGRVDVFFAAGLLTHVPDPQQLLGSLAACARPGGRLAVFHPIGRAALAQRHGRVLRPGELLDPVVLPGVLAAAGWTTEFVDDDTARYLAVAVRDVAGPER